MTTSVVCRWCGRPQVGTDMFCGACGQRAAETDRVEIDAGRAAGISDRGLVRRQNEDALFVEAPASDCCVVVVCDGVASTPNGDIAARVAVQTAGPLLVAAVQDSASSMADAMRDAVAAARRTVGAVNRVGEHHSPAPGCTFASVVTRSNEITVGWLGDSRAYWVDEGGSQCLTTDDSWAEHQARLGTMSAETIAADRRAGWITSWLGTDAPDMSPHVSAFHASVDGRLLVCSDGLWSYFPRDGGPSSWIHTTELQGTPMALARTLANHAVAAGGRDNITVAVVEVTLPEKEAS